MNIPRRLRRLQAAREAEAAARENPGDVPVLRLATAKAARELATMLAAEDPELSRRLLVVSRWLLRGRYVDPVALYQLDALQRHAAKLLRKTGK